MEPINHDYTRERALELAVMFIQSRPRYSPEQTVDIAQLFLNWLNDVEVE